MTKNKLLAIVFIVAFILITGIIRTFPEDFNLRNAPTPTRVQNDYVPDFPDYEKVLKPDLSKLWQDELEKKHMDEKGTYRKTINLPQSLSFDFSWFYVTVYDHVSGRQLSEVLVSHAPRIRNLDEEAKSIQSLSYGSQKVLLPDLDEDRYVEREVTLKEIGDKDIAYYDFYKDERWSRIYMMYNVKKDKLIYLRCNIYPLFMTNKTSLEINLLDPPQGDIYLEIISRDEVKRFLKAVESAIQ